MLNQYDIGDGEMLQYGDEHELVYYDGNTYSYIGDTRLETVSGANRLGQMENIEYKLGYDALGRCVKRVTDRHAKFFAYDGEKAILEFDENGQYIANTLYGRQMDEVLARDNNGSGQYFMQDRNLNTVVVTGGDGSVVESYRYDAFGAPTFYHYNVDGTVTADDKTQINNRFLFTGREWNGNFGFYEYRARAYHPVLGRFMSEDPKGFDAGDYNLYRYVRNDPWDLTDPMGLDTLDVYIWGAQVSTRSIGHVYIRDRDVNLPSVNGHNPGVSSPFPVPRSTHAPQQQFDLDRATQAEGRKADFQFKVQTDPKKNDQLRKVMADQASRPTWDVIAARSNETNCAVAGRAILQAGGYKGDPSGGGMGATPGDLASSLDHSAQVTKVTIVLQKLLGSNIPQQTVIVERVKESR